MTDTTAPNTYVRTLAETAVRIVADHWGKALASALSAFVAAAITYTFTPRTPVASPVAPKVEIVRTIPAGLEAKIMEVAEVCRMVEAKVDELKPKARRKK